MKKLALLTLALMCILLMAMGCDSPTATITDESSAGASGEGANEQDLTDLAIGTVIDLDGLKVSVDEVKKGPKDLLDKATTEVVVTYTNNAEASKSFNEWDWKIEDASGVRANDFAMVDADGLGSGDLAPGGTKTGSVFITISFDKAKKVVFEPSFWGGDESLIFWTVGK